MSVTKFYVCRTYLVRTRLFIEAKNKTEALRKHRKETKKILDAAHDQDYAVELVALAKTDDSTQQDHVEKWIFK